MSDAEFNLLLENATRRKLTAVEEARLRAHLASDPSAKAVWEEEMALSQLLDRLPDAPLATNFAAQVLEAVEREERRHRHTPPRDQGLDSRRVVCGRRTLDRARAHDRAGRAFRRGSPAA